MATTRRGDCKGEARRVPQGIIDVPEVGRIMDGSKFSKLPKPTIPKVQRDPRFQKLAAHYRGRSNTATRTPKHKVDHISRMPDEILKFIVSLLTMREAAVTSILSRRWRNLWAKSLSSLNFNVPNMIGHDYPVDIFQEKSQHYIMTKRLKFTKWVNKVIRQIFCHASRLDALRVSFVLDKDSARDIDRWIMSSVARGVTEFHLDFHHDRFYGDLHDPYKEYEFPAQVVASTVRYLSLRFCTLHLPPDFTGFTSLVSLSIYDAEVTQSLMEDIILSKCPLLEYLSLRRCESPDGTSFKFTGTSLRLKHLHIDTTYGVTDIEVHNINLLSFELGMSSSKLSIQNAPHLSRLVLVVLDPVDIVSNTPRLETLLLLQTERTPVVPQTYVFNNLKRLVFIPYFYTTDLLGVVHILEACHLLQNLELDMGLTDERGRESTMPGETLEKLRSLPGFPLSNLKEIEIYGFEAYPEKVEIAKYLLKNAVVLQKMKIYTKSKVYRGNGRWVPREKSMNRPTSLEKVRIEKRAAALEKIHKKLQDIVRSSTKVELFRSLSL